MACVSYKPVLTVAILFATPALSQEAYTPIRSLDGLEATRDYVAPDSSPFADARFQALELRVQALEEALTLMVERFQIEKERRQRLEKLLRNAGVIR